MRGIATEYAEIKSQIFPLHSACLELFWKMAQCELINSGFFQFHIAPRDESSEHTYPQKKNFHFRCIVFCAKVLFIVAVCFSWKASAQYVTYNGFSTGYSNPLQTAAPFIIDVGINYPGASITNNFYLTNSSTHYSLFLTSAIYHQPSGTGNIPQSLELPSQCFIPATGWQILPIAVGQTLTPSLSAVFSIVQPPAKLNFGLSGTNAIIISSQQYASVDQTNLTITNPIYIQAFPMNSGCTTATNDLDYVLSTNGIVTISGTELTTTTGVTQGDTSIPFGPLAAGQYTVTLTIHASNPLIQTNKSFTVASPATITAQPTSITTNVGGSATFNLTASGYPFLSFQWRFNGVAIANATNGSYTFKDVQTTNSGSYSCFVQNYAGSATSSNAILQVNVPIVRPTFTSFSLGANGNIMMTVRGAAGSTNIIQNSPDLLNWKAVSTNINTTGTFSVSLPVSVKTNGFYRVLLPQ